MPIIYTYPTVTPENGDLVVLSDVSASGKPTKSATISSILDLSIKTTKVTLSAAQVQALNVTPVQLVAAPGAGKALQILSVMGFLDFNSVAYPTALVSLAIRYNGLSTNPFVFSPTFQTAVADAYMYAGHSAGSVNQWFPNTAIEIIATSAPGAGDSPITIWVTHTTIDT